MFKKTIFLCALMISLQTFAFSNSVSGSTGNINNIGAAPPSNITNHPGGTITQKPIKTSKTTHTPQDTLGRPKISDVGSSEAIIPTVH